VLQFLTSWPLLVALAMLLMALVLLIEPAAPFSCEGPCSDWPGGPCCAAATAASGSPGNRLLMGKP
jgi:hypothetical protein